MNRLGFLAPLALTLFVTAGFLTMTGCSGFGPGDFPETTQQITPQGISGSNYGGHAPIVASHVFVMEAESTGGYGGKATSLLSSSTSGAIQDETGSATTNPTFGLFYVTTDAQGGFTLPSGSYTCTSGRPVYLYAQGGSPSTGSATVGPTVTSITVTNNFALGTSTYAFTAPGTYYVGEPVSFNGFTKDFGTVLNGTASTVLSVGTNTFTLNYPSSLIADGTYGQTGDGHFGTAGVATLTTGNNAQVVNLAVLGNCPTSAPFNFASASFVFMNEVSTVATAYALAGFAGTATTGVTVDATHIGSSATTRAITGLQNAAANANQLYDITGGNQSTTYDGEGHIARAVTPAGNGIVPQMMLDTLGNILAACVDSVNTYNPYPTSAVGTQSSQCVALFGQATSNGGATGGTVPLDTATAAFNIAHLPAGASANTSAFMTGLYTLPASFPFTPQLGAQPNDFTVAIQYPLSKNSAYAQAESIGIDSGGNVWINSYGNRNLVKISPLGVIAVTTAAASGYSYGYLSIDPSDNIWSGGNFTVTNETEYDKTGTLLSGTGYVGPYVGGFYDGYITVTDSSGNAYIGGSASAASGQWGLIKMNSSGVNVYYSGGTSHTGGATPLNATPVVAGDEVAHGAIDNATDGGDVWLTTELGTAGGYSIGRYNPTTGVQAFAPITASITAPEMPGIDSSSTLWAANQNGGSGGSVVKVTTGGTLTTLTGGLLAGPFGVAIDGLGNAFVANRGTGNGTGTSTIVEYNNGGTAISPATNYTLAGQVSHPLNLAVDLSGVVWMTSFDSSMVVEMLGQAAPATTPLSYASGQNKLGVRP